MAGGTSPARTPRLEVRWGGGWAEFRETLRAWYEGIPTLPPELRPAFRDAAVGKHWPGRAVSLSTLAHILLLVLPVPAFVTLSSPRAASEFPRIEFDLQWTGTSRVLPPISPPRTPKRKPSPGGKPNQPLPPLGAERLNRQTIVSTPENPNHPTHTVIRQNALEARVKPQELKLPNMVIPPAPTPEATNELDLRRMRVPNAPLDLSGPPQTPRPPKRARSAVTMAEMQLKNLYPRLAVEPGNEGDGRSTAPEIEAPLGAARRRPRPAGRDCAERVAVGAFAGGQLAGRKPAGAFRRRALRRRRQPGGIPAARRARAAARAAGRADIWAARKAARSSGLAGDAAGRCRQARWLSDRAAESAAAETSARRQHARARRRIGEADCSAEQSW
jgi:hypothetical protein